MTPEKRFPILQFFAFEHLPPHLRGISERFSHVAHHVAGFTRHGDQEERILFALREVRDYIPSRVETDTARDGEAKAAHRRAVDARDSFWAATQATPGSVTEDIRLGQTLRLLLEAKDCAVRAAIKP